jgi:recombinational DNA repair ATPase RecF
MKTLPMFMALTLLVVNVVPAAEPARAPVPAPANARSEAAKPPEVSKPAATAASTVELDTTQITGNRELPRVLYVVPWKRADLGQISGKPTRSLLDEVLAPVDRDVFQRQNRYHAALQPDAAAAVKVDGAASAPVAPQAN